MSSEEPSHSETSSIPSSTSPLEKIPFISRVLLFACTSVQCPLILATVTSSWDESVYEYQGASAERIWRREDSTLRREIKFNKNGKKPSYASANSNNNNNSASAKANHVDPSDSTTTTTGSAGGSDSSVSPVLSQNNDDNADAVAKGPNIKNDGRRAVLTLLKHACTHGCLIRVVDVLYRARVVSVYSSFEYMFNNNNGGGSNNSPHSHMGGSEWQSHNTDHLSVQPLTPLTVAANSGLVHTCELLITKFNTDPMQPTNAANSSKALHYACQSGNLETVELLYKETKKGYDEMFSNKAISPSNFYGGNFINAHVPLGTALTRAIASKSLPVVEFLLRKMDKGGAGASPVWPNPDRWSPMDVAVLFEDPEDFPISLEMVKLLYKAGAPLCQSPHDATTPNHRGGGNSTKNKSPSSRAQMNRRRRAAVASSKNTRRIRVDDDDDENEDEDDEDDGDTRHIHEEDYEIEVDDDDEEELIDDHNEFDVSSRNKRNKSRRKRTTRTSSSGGNSAAEKKKRKAQENDDDDESEIRDIEDDDEDEIVLEHGGEEAEEENGKDNDDEDDEHDYHHTTTSTLNQDDEDERLIQMHISPEEHMSPLLLAAEVGNLRLIDWLLQTGADPTAKNGLGQTCLHICNLKRHDDCVKFLVMSGCVDIHAKDLAGDDAFSAARKRQHLEMVTHFKDHSFQFVNHAMQSTANQQRQQQQLNQDLQNSDGSLSNHGFSFDRDHLGNLVAEIVSGRNNNQHHADENENDEDDDIEYTVTTHYCPQNHQRQSVEGESSSSASASANNPNEQSLESISSDEHDQEQGYHLYSKQEGEIEDDSSDDDQEVIVRRHSLDVSDL